MDGGAGEEWPVAMRRALLAKSVNHLILCYVRNEFDVQLFAAKHLRLDVMHFEPLYVM